MNLGRFADVAIAATGLAACVLIGTGPRVQQFAFVGDGGVIVTYAYGPPGELTIAGEAVELTRQRQAGGTLFDNTDALLVGDQPYLALTPYQGRLPTFRLVRDPFTDRLSISNPGRIDVVVYFNGERWFTGQLAPANLFGERVVQLSLRESLRGWGGLSNAEGDLVQRVLESHRVEVTAAIFPDGLATDLPEMDPRPASRNRIRVEYVLGATTGAVLEMPVQVTLRQVADGAQSAARTAEVRIARDQQTLDELRALAYGHLIGGTRPAWDVDLAQGPVVGIFLGMRPSGGYAVVVDEAVPAPDGVLLRTREIKPAPDAMVTMAITYPWIAVQVITGDPMTPVTVR
jgi:hypothetical protein